MLKDAQSSGNIGNKVVKNIEKDIQASENKILPKITSIDDKVTKLEEKLETKLK